MRSYLLYSSSAHFVVLLALFLFARSAVAPRKEQAYFIDFIGQSSVVNMTKAPSKTEGPDAAKAAETKKEEKATEAKIAQPAKAKAAPPDEDDFSSSPLPKPSILSSGAKLFEAKPLAALADTPGGGEPLVAEAPNFPYPWYITQVREALWNSWTERMPSGGTLRCTVKFVITRGGEIKSLSVEKSSGNRLFDNAAESSARAAAPFQPLPSDFPDDRLTVHVEFKAGEQ